MKVVTNSEASRIASVSRQAIQDLKRINTDNKRKYPFFVFDPESGKPGVNIDHKDWISYLHRNQGKRVKLKMKSNKSKGQVSDKETDDFVNKDAFAQAVVSAAREQLGMSDKDLRRFMGLIEVKYEGNK